MFLAEPRGFSDPARVVERRALLATRAEAQPLRTYVAELAKRRGVLVPDPDPADACVTARVLVVLEAPGPMTVQAERPGSGFISVDNDDPTAQNLWRARDAAGLHQDTTAIWNMVPWFLGPASKKPTADERGAGALELRRFMALLPGLRVVVLAGNHAQQGWIKHIDHLLDERPVVIPTPHPAAMAMTRPGARAELDRGLQRAATYL